MDVLTYIKAILKIRSPRLSRWIYLSSNWLWNKSRALPSAHAASDALHDFLPDTGSSSIIDPKPMPEIKHDLAVIVAAYNMEKYLAECLASLLTQDTHYDFVVKVVDDASTDDTAAILQRYAGDCRVEVITHSRNQGLSAARNSALVNLDSRYVACVDADDKLAEGAIEKALDRAYASHAEIIEVCITKFLDDGTIVSHLQAKDSNDTRISEITCQPTIFVYDRKFYERIQFPVGYWYEDVIFEMLIFPQAKKIASESAPYYLYRERPGSITQSVLNPKQIDSLYGGMNVISDSFKLGLWDIEGNRPYHTSLVCHIIRITYVRTCRFSVEIRKSIFVRWREFLKTIEKYLQVDSDMDRRLLESFKRDSYKDYEINCIIDFYFNHG